MAKNYTKEIFDRLGEIKGEISGIHTQMKVQNGRIAAHGTRINDTEKDVNIAKGKAIGAGFIAGAIGSIIMIGIAVFTFFRK